MAQIKVFTYENLVKYDEKIKTLISKEDAKSIKTVSISGNTLKFYKVANPNSETVADIEITLPETDLTEINANIKKNADAINAINDETTGILATAKTYADGKVSTLENGAVKDNADAISAEIERATAAEGVNASAIATLNGDETTEGSVSKAVKDAKDSVEAKIGDISTLTTTAKTDVVSAVNEVKADVANAQTAGEVTIDTTSTTEGYLKSYTIKQGGTKIGVVDIPKDLVVTSGEVVVDPEGQPTGTYIKLTIANQDDPIYINVKSLVDVYTAEQSATQIQLAISDTNEISATIVVGSVGTTELADGAVTTVKIADANVTLAKLADDVKNAFDAAGSADTAETNAKTYADGLNTAMDARVAGLETKVGDGFVAITDDEIDALFV